MTRLSQLKQERALLARFENRDEFHDLAERLLSEGAVPSVFQGEAERQRAWSFEHHEFAGAEFPTWCPQGWAWRVWDDKSQSQRQDTGTFAFQALGITSPLTTDTSRRDLLKTHANRKSWQPTPFVSLTWSADEAVLRAERQFYQGQENVRITLVDLRTRWRSGLPFVHAHREMQHYGVADLHRRENQYDREEVLCLWGITQPEVLQTWTWTPGAGLTAQQLRRQSEPWLQADGETEADVEAEWAQVTRPTPAVDNDLSGLTEGVANVAVSAAGTSQSPTGGQMIPQIAATSEDARWILLQYPRALQLLPNAMHPERLGKQISRTDRSSHLLDLTLWLVSTAGDEEDVPAIAHAAFVNKDGVAHVLTVVADIYWLCWRLDHVAQGDLRPLNMKRCDSQAVALELATKFIKIANDGGEGKSEAG